MLVTCLRASRTARWHNAGLEWLVVLNVSALLFTNINNNNNNNDCNSDNNRVWTNLFIPITTLKPTTTTSITSNEPFTHTSFLSLTLTTHTFFTDCNIKSEDMQWLASTVLSFMGHVTKLSLSRETLPLNSHNTLTITAISLCLLLLLCHGV